MKKTTMIAMYFIVGIFLLISNLLDAQPPYWKLNGNLGTGPDAVTLANNNIGTVFGNQVPINIKTNGNNTARFSVNSGLPSIIQGSVPGDGLTIRSLGGNPLHNLDMWVDRPSPPTINAHIRWGQFGLIEGGSNRLQITGYIEGTEIIASISNKTNVL